MVQLIWGERRETQKKITFFATTFINVHRQVVKPKLEALRIAEVKLEDAQKELQEAESKLQSCQDVLTKLQSKFEAQMAKKRAIEDNAARTRSRMEQVIRAVLVSHQRF